MSNEEGGDNTQNSQGQEGSQKPDTSKVFSNGYNEGVSTQEKRVLQKFSDITGQDFSNIDDVYEWGKTSSSKLAESVSDPTATDEYKELQSTVNQWKEKANEAQQTAQQIQNQYKFDSTYNEAASQIKEANKYKIPESDVKDLFLAKHKVEYKDGKPIVKKGDMPVMDDAGNYKPLGDVIRDFSKNYTEPATGGTGGGSGDGSGVKPKFADFKEANKANNAELMSKLINQAKSAGGWAEPDAPKV